MSPDREQQAEGLFAHSVAFEVKLRLRARPGRTGWRNLDGSGDVIARVGPTSSSDLTRAGPCLELSASDGAGGPRRCAAPTAAERPPPCADSASAPADGVPPSKQGGQPPRRPPRRPREAGMRRWWAGPSSLVRPSAAAQAAVMSEAGSGERKGHRHALRDGPAEEPGRPRHCQQRRDGAAARRLTENRHKVRVAAECPDDVVDPLQGGEPVEQAAVARLAGDSSGGRRPGSRIVPPRRYGGERCTGGICVHGWASSATESSSGHGR